MIEVNKNVQNGVENFEDENFAAMLEEYDRGETSDSLCEGTIIAIHNESNEAFVDVNRKAEGILNLAEITNQDGTLKFNEGDKIKIMITGNKGGKPLVSYEKALRKEKVKSFIETFNEENENIFNVKVISRNKGGFVAVDKDDIEFFIPRSQAIFKDPNQLRGKRFDVKVIKVDPQNQSIIASRKKLIDDERKRKKEIIANILQNDQVVEGIVKKITTYGMFVDIGGIDGLVHYSEISYKGPVNPGNLYKEGDKVEVKVINYDNEKRHLSLSIKAAMPDPWEEIKDSLEVGYTIKVIVSNIEPYGAFVDLGNDIEGFLHISEISWDKNIKNPKDLISENQELDVEVIEIDTEARRLRVSLKNLLPKPFDEFCKNYKEGDIAKGEVTSLTKFGAFVKIGAIEGLLHNEDISWDRAVKCQDLLQVGDTVEVKIIKIDRDGQKISLSKKELEDNPTQDFAKNNSVGDIVKGTIKDIKDFGIFVELENNIEALIKKEDIVENEAEALKIGDQIEAVVAFIDEKRNRIRLSVKRLAKQKEREVLEQINGDDKLTLGDLIKEQLS